jgi:hypothetical protein
VEKYSSIASRQAPEHGSTARLERARAAMTAARRGTIPRSLTRLDRD